MTTQTEMRKFSTALLKTAKIETLTKFEPMKYPVGIPHANIFRKYNDLQSRLSKFNDEIEVLVGLNIAYGIESERVDRIVEDLSEMFEIIQSAGEWFEELKGYNKNSEPAGMLYLADLYLQFWYMFDNTNIALNLVEFVNDVFCEEMSRIQVVEMAYITWALFQVEHFLKTKETLELKCRGIDHEDVYRIIYELTPFFTNIRHMFDYRKLHQAIEATKLTPQQFRDELEMLETGCPNSVLLTLGAKNV